MLDELEQQHARKASVILGIPTDFVRKDYFVTKAIYYLSNIQNIKDLAPDVIASGMYKHVVWRNPTIQAIFDQAASIK